MHLKTPLQSDLLLRPDHGLEIRCNDKSHSDIRNRIRQMNAGCLQLPGPAIWEGSIVDPSDVQSLSRRPVVFVTVDCREYIIMPGPWLVWDCKNNEILWHFWGNLNQSSCISMRAQSIGMGSHSIF